LSKRRASLPHRIIQRHQITVLPRLDDYGCKWIERGANRVNGLDDSFCANGPWMDGLPVDLEVPGFVHRPGINPSPGLIDPTMMTLLGVGERYDKAKRRVCSAQKPKRYGDNTRNWRAVITLKRHSHKLTAFCVFYAVRLNKIRRGSRSKQDHSCKKSVFPDSDFCNFSCWHSF